MTERLTTQNDKPIDVKKVEHSQQMLDHLNLLKLMFNLLTATLGRHPSE